MNSIHYCIIQILCKFAGGGNSRIVKAFRKEGMIIGENTHIFSNIAASEPYLVSIGNNCTISTDVCFLTHDASIGVFWGRDNYSDICGRITVGNNVFIGNHSIILYGVTIPDNTLVAAGSVVTKSISESGCIVGGNPARVIGRVDEFLAKNKDKMLSINGLVKSERKYAILNSGKLVVK